MSERLLVALGGNALVADPHRPTLADQLEAIRRVALQLAETRASGVQVVLTHGNGPQVGAKLQQVELARGLVPESTLDAIDADTQGSIGYQLQQAIGNALRGLGQDDRVATVITQVVVDPDDPAFRHPTKPIGRAYTELEARLKMAELGWVMADQPGQGWRRVVASPAPRRIVEAWAIRALAQAGALVIGCGGGGIPVAEGPRGLTGVAAVIDKDRAAALLAEQIEASRLLFVTGVPRLFQGFGGADPRPLGRVGADEARQLLELGEFPPGSMGPKVESALAFLAAGGREAIITDPAHIALALAGEAGTRIVS